MSPGDAATRGFTITVAGLSLGAFLIAAGELSTDTRDGNVGLYDRVGGGILGGLYVTAMLLPVVLVIGGLVAAVSGYAHLRHWPTRSRRCAAVTKPASSAARPSA